MAQTLAQITKQIEKLQKEANALRQAELTGVVDRIKVAISHFGLTAEQLGFGKSVAKGPKPATSAAKNGNKAPAPRFSNEEGQVWSGRGPRPRWLREALANGRSLEEFSTERGKRQFAGASTIAPRNEGAKAVAPKRTNVIAKSATTGRKPTSRSVRTASSPSDAAVENADAPSDAAPKGKRDAKVILTKSASAKKSPPSKAVPDTSRRAAQATATDAGRVAAGSDKAATAPRVEPSSVGASAA